MNRIWKLVCVLILTYVFLAGLLFPLKPGILNVSPNKIAAGNTATFRVEGYNTLFLRSSPAEYRAWLKLDSSVVLAAQNVKTTSDVALDLQFNIPKNLPFKGTVTDFTLILDDPYNGTSVLPSAVFVTKDSSISSETSPFQSAKISNLNTKKGINFPYRNILSETIRNTYFHVPLWFGMMILFAFAVYYSWKYLTTQQIEYDFKAEALTQIGVLFGVLGTITGAIWAKHTWGAYWSWDVKQNMSAICILIYMAYFVLRNSFDDDAQSARLGAVFNIFAFAAMIPLLFVIPRLTDSLHPGNGGNPAFGSQDLDNTMRMIFYPAVVGWTLLGLWIADTTYRYKKINFKMQF